ncbi:MAG TPA: DNA polymerase Y family protein [Acidimicrobiales bacterium]|nr:DNA polymerase Y family protein [Acidimicrobiales bacterium]
MRTLVLRCPEWSVVAAGAVPDQPLAVVHANRIVASSPAARFEGVMPGLRRREAQGRCPSLEVIAADLARDARAFEVVAVALDALTPRIEITRPGRIAFATRGPSRYFGGDEMLIEKVVSHATEALGARVAVAGPPVAGIADSAFAAELATGVIPHGASAEFLAPLPTSAFPVIEPDLGFDDLVDLLARLGIRSLGQLAALPASDVAARFGPLGTLAHRLANGRDGRLLDERPVPPELAVVAELDPPADRVDHAAFIAKALADDLQDRLDTRGLACTRIAIEAETEHGEQLVRLWRHEGGLTPAAVAERARWQLDGWLHSTQRPTSGITLLRLVPDEVGAARGHQMGFWGGRTLADERAARALARVQGLLGVDAVSLPEVRGGRSPGEHIALVPVGLAEPGRMMAPAPDAPWPGRVPPPLPAAVHVARRQVEVRDRHGEPVVVSGRGLLSCPPATIESNGRTEEIEAWSGPWVFDERWWAADERRRQARMQIVVAGGSAHLLVLEQRRWWIEATYD